MDRTDLTEALYAQILDFKPRKGDLRKVSILEAAIDLIAGDGVESLTFESVGKKAGMNRAHVAYYFPNRDDIIRDAIKFVVSTVQMFTVRAVAAARDPKEKLEAFVDGTFEWMHTFPKHSSAVVLMYYYSVRHSGYRKLHTEVRTLGAERISAILEPHVPMKHRDQLDRLAKLVQAILTGHLIAFVTTRKKMTLEDLRQIALMDIRTVVDAFARGLHQEHIHH